MSIMVSVRRASSEEMLCRLDLLVKALWSRTPNLKLPTVSTREAEYDCGRRKAETTVTREEIRTLEAVALVWLARLGEIEIMIG